MGCVIGLGDGIGSTQRKHAPGDQGNIDHGGTNYGGGVTAATRPGFEPGELS